MPSTAFSVTPPKRRRVCYSNRLKVLLCYLIAFAVPPLWLLAGLLLVYPYQLAGSAPQVVRHLLTAFPLLDGALGELAAMAANPVELSPEAWAAALSHRDHQWMVFLLTAFGIGWALTLCCQLLWRTAHARPYQAARSAARAIRQYRIAMLLVWLLNGVLAAAVWLLGVQFIHSRTVWDYLIYLAPYGLNALAALCCFRLAAPPVLSGRHAFFKRL